MKQAVLEELAGERINAHAGELLTGVILGDLDGGRLAHAELLIVLLPDGGEERGGVRVRFLKVKLAGFPAEPHLDRLLLGLAEGGREGEEWEKGAGKHGGGDTVGRALWQPGAEGRFFVFGRKDKKIRLEVGTLPAK